MKEGNPKDNFSVVLADAMRAKGISIDKLARRTGISERFLRLILEEKLERLPAAPYLYGYIMKIAEELEMDGEKLWEAYFKNSKHLKSSGVSDRLPKNRFAVSRISKRTLIIAVIIIAIIGYFVIRTLLSFDVSRELTLRGLDDNVTVSQEDVYELRGNISPGFQLTVNDAPVYPEEDGDFEKNIELKPGFNTVTFRIEGLFNKKGEMVKQIYYSEEGEGNGDEIPVSQTDEGGSSSQTEATTTPASPE